MRETQEKLLIKINFFFSFDLLYRQFNMLHLANNFNVNLMKVKFTLFKKILNFNLHYNITIMEMIVKKIVHTSIHR